MGELLKLKFIEGHRTQIVAIVLAALTLAQHLGWLTAEQVTSITGFLISIGLLTASVHKPT